MPGIEEIRAAVLEALKGYDLASLAGGTAAAPAAAGSPAEGSRETGAGAAQAGGGAVPRGPGVFADLDAAVAAAARAQVELVALPLGLRARIVGAMRQTVLANNESLSREAVEETGLGNLADKLVKNRLAALKTPGPEDIEPSAYSDENGLCLVERAPWGVIGAITPTTNPIATITCNAIGMLGAGNAVVFNPHPAARRVSCRLVSLLNEAVMGEGGPANLVATLAEPSIESASRLMKHTGIALLVITGGPAVVRSAMNAGKKAICAGPGNPPCVVDGTADLVKAGAHIVNGAGFDHNIVCICEKEILAVESIADRLVAELRRNGAFLLDAGQTRALTALAIADPGGPGREGAANKALVGKSPRHLARAIGLEVPDSTRILLCEVERDHPLVWTEQLMPFIPLVRMRNVDEAIDFAVEVEHGFRHSAMMHSHDITKLSRMARLMNCSLFVKNGPCYAGLGEGGAGYASFTIASPTGEGITRARSFTRERRCTLVDSFRII